MGLSMGEVRSFKRQDYPADTRTMGSDNSRPPSGYFSLHFTYPDTQYTDATTFTWAGGSSANKLGMHFLVRTNLANDSVGTYANKDNFYVIDLKRSGDAATAASSSLTYDMGTKEAAMMIASSINSSRDFQTGAHSQGRYLRAKYQNMSGRTEYKGRNDNALPFSTGEFTISTSATHAIGSTYVLTFNSGVSLSTIKAGDSLYTAGANTRFIGKVVDVSVGLNKVTLEEPNAVDLVNNQAVRNGRLNMTFSNVYTSYNDVPVINLPTDIPQKGKITSGSTGVLYYDSWKVVAENNFSLVSGSPANQSGEIVFNIYDYATPTDYAIRSQDFTIVNESKQQHTVVVSWETEAPTGGGYWGTANGGPVVQGLGAPLPVWYMTAKPMDGGNMGLPDIKHESRGAQPSALSGHGYSRFSIEGLNSCALPDLPPPDMPFDGPVIMGEVAADPFQWTGLNDQRTAVESGDVLLDDVEFGTELDDLTLSPTDCFVSTNATLSSGQSAINIIASNTNVAKHFGVGDTIFTKNNETVGVVSEISNKHTTTLKTLGPTHRDTGFTVNVPLTATTTLLTVSRTAGATDSHTTSGGASTSMLPANPMIYSPSGEVIGEIKEFTSSTNITLQQNNIVAITANDAVHIQPRFSAIHSHLVVNDTPSGINVRDAIVNENDDLIGIVTAKSGNILTIAGGVAVSIKAGDKLFKRIPITEEVVIATAGANYTTATNLKTASAGSGTGLTVDIEAKGGAVYKATVKTTGSGYSSGEVLSVIQGSGVLVNNGGGYTPPLLTPPPGTITVDTVDATTMFSPTDKVYNSTGQLLGDVAAVTATTIQLVPDLLVPLANNEELFFGSATLTHNAGFTGDEYTQSDFNAGMNLVVYDKDADGVTVLSPEVLGNQFTFNQFFNEVNSGFFVSSDDEILFKVSHGLAGTAHTTYTSSKFQIDELINDIPALTELFRASPRITLVSSTTISLSDGQPLFKDAKSDKWSLALENGYTLNADFSSLTNATDTDYATLNSMKQTTVDKTKGAIKHGFKSERTTQTANTNPFEGDLGYVNRPYRTVRSVNSERVRGLFIPNEERVWDTLPVVDDTGQELLLEGGSPFGTVIKDYTYKQNRINPNTGTETNLPSTVGSGIEPNLEINLPSQDEIPGNILVRSGHDRVQAWSNLTWGMGGLSAPSAGLAGEAESSTKDVRVTAFDTHDRVLHFHPVRILHNKMESQFGLTPNTTVGAVPSGTTRLFASHRLSDHAERGSVLMDSNNGADGSYLHPHHRIRFGRQGHHFVAPLTMRGTPMSLRRQLHRSHGSAYSLLFEAESEHKHWGFQSTYGGSNDPASASLFYLDTMEVKSEAYNTGSFASDGFPMSEIEDAGLPNWRRYDGAVPHDQIDVLFAPGQLHTKVEGAKQQAQWITNHHGKDIAVGPYGNAATSGPIALATGTRTVNSRHNAGEEFTLNGFMVSQYLLMGGRPDPSMFHGASQAYHPPYVYAMTGHNAGWRTARVGTELATVPPLIAHDPEMVNMSAVPVANVESPSSASHFDAEDTHADLALVSGSDTNSKAIPDAFLCTWLAEYSHPALLGTNREHYMTFRYREAGMPCAVDQPSVRGLFLRNAPSIDSSSVNSGMPFERVYAFQWLQQYGYNGLNAGGHGSNWGQRAAGAVLMGHSGLREPHGTLQLRQHFTLRGASTRYSRGEGIGDGLNPRKDITRFKLDADLSNSYEWNQITAVQNPMVAIDWSRRLPVRAFGFRGASDALNMLAGDPAETATNMNAILRSARFDGGKHDSLNDMPTGGDWPWGGSTTYTGVERTVPIGMVVSQQTNEGIEGQGVNRLSNEPWDETELPVGMGRALKEESLGMVSPTAMPSGVMDAHRTEFATITGSSAKFLQAKSMNTGLDPLIGLNYHSGDRAKASDSVEAVYQASQFGASVGNEFYHHKGNNLHLNAHPVDIKANGETDNQHFPAVGWGSNLNMKNKSEAERGTKPIPLHEIADHRQVQSDVAPRLGLTVETHSEITTARNTDYAVTSTKAVSLHSDLAVGQMFPITPSWVQETRWTKYGASENSITTTAARPDETYGGQANPNQRDSKPKWTLNENKDLNAITNTYSDDILQANGAGIRDHWAVRGSADLPAWGGVFVLRKTWLERPENTDSLRSKQGGKNSAIKAQIAQPVRKYADYIVRMVRPLKVFGYTSKTDSGGNAMNQDGWLLGPYSTMTDAGSKDQPFTRDKRYGMFETTTASQIGDIQGISSPYDSAPTIEWPDANNRDVVWHLIPSANMLQHFKSDASRRDATGALIPLVEPRYSQSTHPGGGEYISQTETVYATDQTVVLDPYLKRDKDANAVVKQPSSAMLSLGAKATVKFDAKNTKIVVDDATAFPKTGFLVIVGLSGQISYGSRTHNSFNSLTTTGDCASTDLTGKVVRSGKNGSTSVDSKIENVAPADMGLVVLPSLIDNAVSVGRLLTDKWDATTSDDSAEINTNMTYKGIGHYEPSDFFMLSPQSFAMNDGQNTGLVRYHRKPGTGGMSKVYVDGVEMTPTRFPPYLIDAQAQKWRVAKASNNEGEGDVYDTFLTFKNLTENTLSDSGVAIESVRLGQHMGVGLRTTDMALMLLKDTIESIPGMDIDEFRIFLEQKSTDTAIYATYSSNTQVGRQAFVFAHPHLHDAMLHSKDFISRKARGIGILDVLRDLSRIDGHQLTLADNGILIYSPNVFKDSGRAVGTSSGPQNISISTMLEMANEVIVEGETIAQNETIRATVQDLEKMKEMGGVGNEDGLKRTMRVNVAGIKERVSALRLARGLLRRSTQGSSLIRVEGLIKSSDIQPGEIIRVDFPTEGIKGEFAVFEVTTDYNTGLSDIVIGQYEKGIEGLLADLQSATISMVDEDPTNTHEQIDITLNASIRVVAAHRVMTRFVNGTRLLIGGRWRGEPTTNQLGVIGVRGGDTGVLINNGGGYGTSTTTMTVDGHDATERFKQHDAVLNASHQVIGYVQSVASTTITLKAGSLVAVSDNERLRVASSRQSPMGHSKSKFYEVK